MTKKQEKSTVDLKKSAKKRLPKKRAAKYEEKLSFDGTLRIW